MAIVTLNTGAAGTFSLTGARAFSIDDETGDLQLSAGKWVLVGGLESIRQDMQQKFRLFLGEWFLDPLIGIPYFQKIFNTKNPPYSVLETIFRSEALKVRGVLTVDRIVVGPKVERTLPIDIACTTIAGPLTGPISLPVEP